MVSEIAFLGASRRENTLSGSKCIEAFAPVVEGYRRYPGVRNSGEIFDRFENWTNGDVIQRLSMGKSGIRLASEI